MTQNIDQVAAPEEGIVADVIQNEESADTAQEPDTGPEQADNAQGGEATPDDVDDPVQDLAVETGDEEADVDDDEPAAS